tara:strand:- start:868 stop:2124 length:1257 start_codon:yes stop_codon:yes gene_type:complete
LDKANTYQARLELDKLIPLFKGRGIDLTLERIKEALKYIGQPCKDKPAIQIIGTNGKGSIASFLMSTLKHSKIKAGIYTSPHLINWNERIVIDGIEISDENLINLLTKLKVVANKFKLTPFELITTAALQYFESNSVELLVLEAGLGGRLDATTAHNHRPIIAIGGIGKDHCEYLGNTLREIAYEKTAVISSGSCVISGPQQYEVKKIIEKVVKKRKAEIFWVNALDYSWDIGLQGNIQRENAAVAKCSLEQLYKFGWKIDESIIRKGISTSTWIGRLETVFWQNKEILIDGAHNPHAIIYLSKERIYWENEQSGVNWILGIQANKDAPKIIEELIKPQDQVFIVPIPNHQSWTSSKFKNANSNIKSNIKFCLSAEEALLELSEKDNWTTNKTVITGSLYLIGDLLSKKILKYNLTTK